MQGFRDPTKIRNPRLQTSPNAKLKPCTPNIPLNRIMGLRKVITMVLVIIHTYSPSLSLESKP